MENCLYHGKTICTFDLKDKNGIYYEDMVLEWKQAAADRELFCVECGAPVYLAAGPIKEPYFAHYDIENCDYGNGHETEELRKGKRLLYAILKQSFPEGDIRARYRMENGMYSTLYCMTPDCIGLAIDYRLLNNSLQKFRQRDTFYQENHIKPVYVMGIRQMKDTKQIDWYQSLLQSSMGYLAFMDPQKEYITLKKSFGYRLGKERKFQYCIKSYPIRELFIDIDGQMLCDFKQSCLKIEEQIMEEKSLYDRQQKHLQRLQEESLKLQVEDRLRQEAYRLGKEEKERVSINQKTNPDMSLPSRTEDSLFLRNLPNDQNPYDHDPSYRHTNMSDLNPELLEKCKKMIEEGNAHLVSKKYFDAIMSDR